MSEMEKFAIILIGLPGSGKTTIAQCLLEHFRCHYFSSDTVRVRLFGNPSITEDRDYTKEEIKIVYNALSYIVDIRAQHGENMMTEGFFRNKKCRDEVCEILTQNGYNMYKYHIICDEDILEERLIRRSMQVNIATSGVKGYRIARETFEYPVDSECYITIDNSGELEVSVNEILQSIKNVKTCKSL